MEVALPFIEGWVGVDVFDAKENGAQCSLPPVAVANKKCGQPEEKGIKPLQFESLYGDLIPVEKWEFEKFSVQPRSLAKTK